MISINSKNWLLLAALIGLFLTPSASYAIDTSIEASITTRLAVSAIKGNDMNFGLIEYDVAHSGDVLLGTDGSVQLSSASGLNISGGSATAADISFSGDTNSTIEISCETGGVLSASNGDTLTLSNVEFALDSGVSAGAGTACTGLGTASSTIDLSANPTPTMFFGATVNIASNAISTSSNFSTTQAGGDQVTIRVVYQ